MYNQTQILVKITFNKIQHHSMYWKYYIAVIAFTVDLDNRIMNQHRLIDTADQLELPTSFIFRYILRLQETEEETMFKMEEEEEYLDIGEDMNVPDDFTQSELQTGKWWRHLLAGGIAGAFSRTCTAPLDRLKVSPLLDIGLFATTLFSPSHPSAASDPLKVVRPPCLRTPYTTFSHPWSPFKDSSTPPFIGPATDLASPTPLQRTNSLSNVVDFREPDPREHEQMPSAHDQRGGVAGLWRGNGINVIKIAPESALKFAAYEQVKRLILGDRKNQPLEIYERFAAGATAGAISQTVIYPLEVLKTRLALRKTGQYHGIADAFKKIYAREGLRCFYKGYIPNILGIVPYAGIDLAVYETLKKKYINKYHQNSQPGMLLLLACGSASCTLGQVCSYPLALVRTRLQAQEKAAKVAEGTMRGVFRDIVQREGVLGLYRGITPNFIKVIPAVSISYVVYEYASRSLGVNMT
ncbi:hypothetical protein MSG28_001180 [Choristoneura fumiferana]|uniref:Uncharacterized protein n=1 Tax=Choristoneura fumiferana TaxID=7141 RepID=A0ACC0K445_CHOFU|nr:hypothetical protein MSG28_001180 [Choristoneura fumiferana]